MFEKELFYRLPHSYMHELFLQNFERSFWGWKLIGIFSISQFQCISKKICSRLPWLTKIIDSFRGNYHFRHKGHFVNALSLNTMKEASDIRISRFFISNRQSGFHQRLRSHGAKEPDGVEQVGFPGRVGAGYAGERTKADIYVHKILESVDLQSRKHSILRSIFIVYFSFFFPSYDFLINA